MATKTRLTLEEFLALPETEPPSEYFDEEVVQKAFRSIAQSALVVELGARFLAPDRPREYLVGTGGQHVSYLLKAVYLPDVHLTRLSRLAGHEDESPLTVVPDVVVEVLSPDDRPSAVLQKVETYVELQVPVLLLVDPADRTIRVYRSGSPAHTLHEGETLDLTGVLPGFTMPLTDLFAVIPPAAD
jgi:Uma2 family endonuclease